MLTTSTAEPLPSIFVPKEVINERVVRYLETKHPILSDALSQFGPTRQDTRCIWYSREHIETWMNEIRLMDADGMRVYLGAYGPENEAANGQLCLLMVLTRADNGLHKDIILEYEPDYDLRLQAARKRSILVDDDSDSTKGREYNYGSPCPPICPTNEQAFPM